MSNIDDLLSLVQDRHFKQNHWGLSFDLQSWNTYLAITSDLDDNVLELFLKEIYKRCSIEAYTKMFLTTLGQFDPYIFWMNYPNFVFYNFIKDFTMTIFLENEKFMNDKSNLEPRLFGYISKLMNGIDIDLISSRYDNVISRSRLLIEVAALMAVDDKSKVYTNRVTSVVIPKKGQIYKSWKDSEKRINEKSKNKININSRNEWTKGKNIFNKKIKDTNKIHSIYIDNHSTESEYLSNFWSISSHFSHASTALVYSIGWEHKGLRLLAHDESKKVLLITLTDVIRHTTLIEEENKGNYIKSLERAYKLSLVDVKNVYEKGFTTKMESDLKNGMKDFDKKAIKVVESNPWLNQYSSRIGEYKSSFLDSIETIKNRINKTEDKIN